ncbi:MAG: Heme oxygenase [Ilumatobacteraceae bacterium]|nr:Heme oxygenase [Ilumatobacteraceae bacterium]
MARRFLREATVVAHQSAESAVDLGVGLTEASYIRVVGLFHGLWRPTFDVLARWSIGVEGVWHVEDRATLARDDLVALGMSATAIEALPRCEVEPPLPAHDGMATAMGYAYVLEGSSLGAATIARRVEDELPLVPASTFLAQDPGRWAAFAASIDRQRLSSVELDQAAVAANRLFAAFEAIAVASRATGSAGGVSARSGLEER